MSDNARQSAAEVRRRLEERAVAHMDREHPQHGLDTDEAR